MTDNVLSVCDDIPSVEEIAEAAEQYIHAVLTGGQTIRHDATQQEQVLVDVTNKLLVLSDLVVRCPQPGFHYHIIGRYTKKRIGCLGDGAYYRDVLREEPGATFVLVDADTCECTRE